LTPERQAAPCTMSGPPRGPISPKVSAEELPDEAKVCTECGKNPAVVPVSAVTNTQPKPHRLSFGDALDVTGPGSSLVGVRLDAVGALGHRREFEDHVWRCVRPAPSSRR
jgi:hypothetical protein